MRGRMKRFDQKKGYGFIQGDDGKEYLVHFTAIHGRPEEIQEGAEVEFEPVDTFKGLQAASVRRIDIR